MTTVSRDLPSRPHLDIPKREARNLLKQLRTGNPEALDRIRRRHPRFKDAGATTVKTAEFRLSDAQLVIAREYGFSHWAELKARINSNTLAERLDTAIRADDRETVGNRLTKRLAIRSAGSFISYCGNGAYLGH